MSRFEIDLLGEPRLRLDGAPMRLGARPKSIVLLALLIVRGEAMSRAALAAALWPDELEADARANLRRHLHDLQRALPDLDADWFKATPNHLEWNREAPAQVDVVEYQRLIEDPKTMPQATELYRGDLLGSSFDESIAADRERFRALQLDALAECAEAAAAARDFAKSSTYAEAILAIDEFREDALRLLMADRYNSGDRSGALASYEKFAARLYEELQAEPMFETIALKEAIVADAPLTHPTAATQTLSVARSFVGRDDELSSLTEIWLGAARGKGSFAFISGEPGIGKTHLAREILRTVASQGGRTSIGTTSAPESTAFQPIVEAVRALLPYVQRNEQHDVWLSVLMPFAPEIARLHRDLSLPPPLEGEAANVRLHEAVIGIIEACSRLRPLALLFEDLHNAHTGTIELVELIARRIPAMPVVVIATYRNTEAPAESPLRALRRDLARAGLAQHFGLSRLNHDHVSSIVRDSGIGAGTTFADDVFRLSEGNPLFAWQLIQHNIERGQPPQIADAIQNVADAIRTRLELLPAEVRTVADVAATIGDTFTIEEIAGVCGMDEGSVTGAFGTLLDRTLVVERTESGFQYAFTHALIGAAIYDATPQDARKIRHLLAANALSRTRKDDLDSLSLIARHWERAGERPAARVKYLNAAKVALDRFARDLAIEHAERVMSLEPSEKEHFAALLTIFRAHAKRLDGAPALEALHRLEEAANRLGDDERFEAQAARVELHSARGDRREQREAVERLLKLAGRWPRRRFRAYLSHADACVQRGAASEALRALDSLVNFMESADDAQRVEYHQIRARALFRDGRLHEARAELAHFRAYLVVRPSLAGEAAYAQAELLGAWICDDAARLQPCAREVIRFALLRGDYLAEAHGHAHLAYALSQLHDTAGARKEYEKTLVLFDRGQHNPNVLITRSNYAMVEYEVGHVERAAKQWKIVGESPMADDCPAIRIASNVNLGEIALRRNAIGEALAHAQAAYDEAVATSDNAMRGNARSILGAALIRSGRSDEGLAHLRALVEETTSTEQPRIYLGFMTTYVEGLLDAGHLQELATVIGELRDIFFEEPQRAQQPPLVCWVLGRAYSECGHEARAGECFDKGRELVTERVKELSDPADRAAYLAMWPNDQLMARSRRATVSRIG